MVTNDRVKATKQNKGNKQGILWQFLCGFLGSVIEINMREFAGLDRRECREVKTTAI